MLMVLLHAGDTISPQIDNRAQMRPPWVLLVSLFPVKVFGFGLIRCHYNNGSSKIFYVSLQLAIINVLIA
jgi:hypothetical protein